MKVRASSAARSDLRALIAHIAPENPSAARRMRDAIRRAIGSLSDNPQRGRALNLRDGRELRRLIVPPYISFYVTDASYVTVTRILHGARDLDAELQRRSGLPDEPG